MHLLSSEKYLFQRRYVATFTCFSSRPFLKQLASHVPANTLLLEIPGYDVFSHPSWKLKRFFLEGFKVCCVVSMKDKSSHIKKKSMMVKTCFFNVLPQLL